MYIQHKQKRIYALLLLLFVTILWGLVYVVLKDALTYISDLQLLIYRFLASGLSLIFFLPFLYTRAFFEKQSVFPGIKMGLWTGALLYFVNKSLLFLPASIVPFYIGIGIVGVTCIDMVQKRKLDLRGILAFILSVIGIACISEWKSGDITFTNHLYGIFLAIICAAQIYYSEKYHRISSPKALALWQILTLTALGGIFALYFVINHDFHQLIEPLSHGNVIFSLFYVGFLCTTFGFTVQILVLKYITAVESAYIFNLEPVIGFFAALYIPISGTVREEATPLKFFGVFCLLIAMVLITFKKSSHHLYIE